MDKLRKDRLLLFFFPILFYAVITIRQTALGGFKRFELVDSVIFFACYAVMGLLIAAVIDAAQHDGGSNRTNHIISIGWIVVLCAIHIHGLPYGLPQNAAVHFCISVHVYFRDYLMVIGAYAFLIGGWIAASFLQKPVKIQTTLLLPFPFLLLPIFIEYFYSVMVYDWHNDSLFYFCIIPIAGLLICPSRYGYRRIVNYLALGLWIVLPILRYHFGVFHIVFSQLQYSLVISGIYFYLLVRNFILLRRSHFRRVG